MRSVPPATTNALDQDADIAKVQELLGHANLATTRIYDRRKMKPADSPTFKVSYGARILFRRLQWAVGSCGAYRLALSWLLMLVTVP